MCCEDRGDVDVPFPTERNGDPSLPFVEMRHDGGSELPGKILDMRGKSARTQERVEGVDLAKEPCDDIAKNDTLVRFVIAGGCRDPC